MTLLLLILAGSLISFTHFYIVYSNKENRKYSISEKAIASPQIHRLYMTAHITCNVLFAIYSYRFFILEQDLIVPFLLNMNFVLFNTLQAILPSAGKTEKMHYITAYVSWVSYLLSGALALFLLPLSISYFLLGLALLIPTLGLFIYIHFNRTKLYPYQLAIVPLFVVYMVVITIGAS